LATQLASACSALLPRKATDSRQLQLQRCATPQAAAATTQASAATAALKKLPPAALNSCQLHFPTGSCIFKNCHQPTC